MGIQARVIGPSLVRVIDLGGHRERLYQPFVEADNVRRLYRLKQLTGRPMTNLINEAIRFYDDMLRERPEYRQEIDSRDPPLHLR